MLRCRLDNRDLRNGRDSLMKAAIFLCASVAGAALIASALADDLEPGHQDGVTFDQPRTPPENGEGRGLREFQPGSAAAPQKVAALSARLTGANKASLPADSLETDMVPPGPAIAGEAAAFVSGAEDDAPLLLNGEAPPYDFWFVKLLPGENARFGLPGGHSLRVDGDLAEVSEGKVSWTAPEETGFHDIEITNGDGETVQQVTAIVLEPAKNFEDGSEDGFRMDEHPRTPPAGYIRLTEEDMDRRITPHFRAGQFICKQQPGHWPKYIALTDPMMRRLEALLISLREDGVTDAETLYVMSGFRSPFYNYGIGATEFSRHMWGDASDVYVDVAPQDGVMDDLNGDGELNKKDADWLYDYAEELFAERDDLPDGGLGSYGANAVHGPFIHVDGRGRAARWGR